MRTHSSYQSNAALLSKRILHGTFTYSFHIFIVNVNVLKFMPIIILKYITHIQDFINEKIISSNNCLNFKIKSEESSE